MNEFYRSYITHIPVFIPSTYVYTCTILSVFLIDCVDHLIIEVSGTLIIFNAIQVTLYIRTLTAISYYIKPLN